MRAWKTGKTLFCPKTSLDDLLSGLKSALKGNVKADHPLKSFFVSVAQKLGRTLHGRRTQTLRLELILDPPRVIRAIIDYKIKIAKHSPKTRVEIEKLILDAVKLAQSVYLRSDSALSELLELEAKIKKKDYGIYLSQECDDESAEAYSPNRSRASAKLLTTYPNLGNILFIALAHGAVPVGLDVYLRFLDATPSSNSVFYPIRFSTEKHKDKKPRLSISERKYLISVARGRNVVLFDEDSSGTTLGRADRFFRRLLNESGWSGEILGLTNAYRNNSFTTKRYATNSYSPALLPRNIKNHYLHKV
jgi:hypothetical protein